MRSDDIEARIYDLMLRDSVPFIEVRDRSVWVIGDVHGCAEEFLQLCLDIRQSEPNAMIVQLGDMIDRGPDLFDQYATANAFNVMRLIGNHEMNFIRETLNGYPCRSKDRIKTHEQFARLSKDKQDFVLDKMLTSYNKVDLDLGNRLATLSHAPLTRTSRTFYEEADSGNGWTYCSGTAMPVPSEEPNDRTMIYVHGHLQRGYIDIYEQLNEVGRDTFNIDSGAVYGKYLTALRLNDLAVRQISCEVDYTA